MSETASAAEPFAPAAFAAMRSHPDFRAAVESHARANLQLYGELSILGRWLVSDLGRSALSGAALILDGVPGGLTAAALLHSAMTNRVCSRGRALAYLRRCELNGLIVPVEAGADRTPETPLELKQGFLDATVSFSAIYLDTTARLAPEVAPARARLEDRDFRRRMMFWIGMLTASRPDLFAGPDMPIDLFLDRDGGTRVLEHLLISQDPGRSRLLDRAPLSRAAIARSSFVSRTHVMRLLEDGEAQGLLKVEGPDVVFSRELSDDAERHYGLLFETARVAALSALNG